MNKSLSTVLLGLGAVLVILGLVVHFAVKALIFPHFSLVVGFLALVLLGVGAYGYFGQSSANR